MKRALTYGLAGLLGIFLSLLALAYWISQPLAGFQSASLLAGPDRFSPEALRTHVEFMCANVARRHHARPATLKLAANYIEENLRASGARVVVDEFEVDGQRYRNVIGRFGATGLPQIVLGAHYDVDEDSGCGADDNASGVAGLLALAANLGKMPPTKAVEIVFYTLEEPPYFATAQMGSRRHAAQLAQAGAQPALVLVLEMIGYFDQAPGSQRYPLPGMGWLYPQTGNFIALAGEFSAAQLTAETKQAMISSMRLPVHSINAPAWVPGMTFSDHASYWQHGIPAQMLTDTAFYRNPNYHRTDDRPETLNYQLMAQAMVGVASAVRHFDTKDSQR